MEHIIIKAAMVPALSKNIAITTAEYRPRIEHHEANIVLMKIYLNVMEDEYKNQAISTMENLVKQIEVLTIEGGAK